MKKYSVCNKIGDVLSGASVLAVFFGACIDLDRSPDSAIWVMAGVFGVGFALALLGQVLYNLKIVEGFVLGVGIVIGAELYNIKKKPSKNLKKCSRIRRECGSVIDTILESVHVYLEYLDSLVEEEDKNERIEQSAAGSSEFFC